MSVHKYNSYGRTRQPKNMAGGIHEAEIAATLPAGAPSLVTDGVSTENQRYLHIYVINSEANTKQVTVWGYIHAFGAWFELYDTAGVQVRHSVGSTATIYKVHEIAGVDRVYFRSTGTAFVLADTAMAAGSTFQGS